MSQFEEQKEKLKAERMEESVKKMEKIREIIDNNQKIEENKKKMLMKKL